MLKLTHSDNTTHSWSPASAGLLALPGHPPGPLCFSLLQQLSHTYFPPASLVHSQQQSWIPASGGDRNLLNSLMSFHLHSHPHAYSSSTPSLGTYRESSPLPSLGGPYLHAPGSHSLLPLTELHSELSSLLHLYSFSLLNSSINLQRCSNL